MAKTRKKTSKKRPKPHLGRIPLPQKAGYTIRPGKGKGSYRRSKKDWRYEDR